LDSFSETLLSGIHHTEESPAIKRLLAICKEACSTRAGVVDIVRTLHEPQYVSLLEMIRKYEGSISFDATAQLSLKRPIAWIFTHIPANHLVFDQNGKWFRSLGLNFEKTQNNNDFESTTGLLKWKNSQWDIVIIHLSDNNHLQENNILNRTLIKNLCDGCSACELPQVVFFAGPAVCLQKDTSLFVIAKSLYNRNHQEPMRVAEHFFPVFDAMKDYVVSVRQCHKDQIGEELESIDLKLDESLNVSEYLKPIEMSSLAWYITQQTGEAIARFTICEVLDRQHVICARFYHKNLYC